MPEFDPLTAIRQIRIQYPEMKILVISAYDDNAYVEGLLRVGVNGYYLKEYSLGDLKLAIEQVLAGRRWISSSLIDTLVTASQPSPSAPALTTRQTQILQLLREGLDNRTISARLGLSIKTVENHLTRLYRQINVQKPLGGHSPRVRASGSPRTASVGRSDLGPKGLYRTRRSGFQRTAGRRQRALPAAIAADHRTDLPLGHDLGGRRSACCSAARPANCARSRVHGRNPGRGRWHPMRAADEDAQTRAAHRADQRVSGSRVPPAWTGSRRKWRSSTRRTSTGRRCGRSSTT